MVDSNMVDIEIMNLSDGEGDEERDGEREKWGRETEEYEGERDRGIWGK